MEKIRGEIYISFTRTLIVYSLSKRACQICQNSISPADSGRYCYLHRQLYESLTAEYLAVKETSKRSNISLKQFLSKKKSDPSLPKELGEVIKLELENS
jgi:hypothetical protein